MLFNSNNKNNVIVYNSITNTLLDEKFDNVQPFSFIEYLNYSKSYDKSIIQFSDYQGYLKKWNEVTLVKFTDLKAVTRQQFIVFLKSIALNFSTNEERRFLSNINFENNDDLEIAVPFFVQKIKDVLLYFAEKRDNYTIDLELAKNKGSISGVTNYLKTTIIETIFANDLQPPITPTVPLSTVSSELQVEIEESYDTFNDYFDLDPYEPASFYEAAGKRQQYFTSNTNTSDKNLFLDYSQAIIDLINSEQVVLEELQSLAISVDQPDLDLLQQSDFIDYNTRTRETLRLVLNAELIKKFTGTDFYYLSCTNTGIVSGLLFEATSPFSNLLNVYNPTTLTVPQSSNKYERDVGLFFKPSIQSLLQLQTPFGYSLKETISGEYVYVFPDPNVYGNISSLTKTDHVSPFNFIPYGEKIQKNISSNNALGNSQVSNNDFTFESYHSLEQNSVRSIMQDLYNVGVVYSYSSDLYGNIYIGFKQQNTNYIKNFENNVDNNVAVFGLSSYTSVPYLSSIKSILSAGTFDNTSTITTSIPAPSAQSSLYTLRNSPGRFVVYNIDDSTINSLSSVYTKVFDKYPTQESEINNNLFSFETFGNTFVLTTSSYVIVDAPLYINGGFDQSPFVPLILQSSVNHKVSNVYQKDNDLFISKIDVTNSPLTSGSNTRYFQISLYSYNLLNHVTTNYAFLSTDGNGDRDNLFSYDLNTFVNVTNVNLIYNKKQDTFNIVVTLKDSSNNLFIHSTFFRISNSVVSVIKEKIFKSNNTNLTVNFFDGSYVGHLLLNTVTTTPTIESSNGTITF